MGIWLWYCVFYGGAALLAATGIVQILIPHVWWQWSRYFYRSEGVATAQAPEDGSLQMVRLRGVFTLVMALAIPLVEFLLSQQSF